MDELERLRAGLRASAPPEPRPQAKEAAISAALAAFDAKKSAASQGSGFLARLRIAAIAASETMTGKRKMRMTHALAGGASLLVLTLAVITTASLQNLPSLTPREADLPAGGPPPVADLTEAAKDIETSDVAASTPPPITTAEQEGRAEVAAADADEGGQLAAAPLELQALPEALARRDVLQPAAPPAASNNFGTLMADQMASLEPALSPDYQQSGEYRDQGRDRFETIETNPLKATAQEPVSTFSIDVDTASYSFMRASLSNGVLPQDDAVRVEELVNYFPYAYPGPETAEEPFRATATIMPSPWNAGTTLIHIGIKGYDIASPARPKANLVFLIDTSGSMDEPNKLPLLVNSLKLLVGSLSPEDTVSIVAYAGAAGTVLEPTSATEKGKIEAALENLSAGGSTAGGEGVRLAYQLARQNFDADGVNRVILATDGDFNVGITDIDELQGFVEREREEGVFLSVLGFGRGNYNDELMQALAQNGNGAAAYIDTLNEARKVLVEEATSTLFPIAKDVKIQVEFNPAIVSEYRLIGYETRLLNREDFNNDQVDAGEIGSGHTVTALYEITPAGSDAELLDDLRYQPEGAAPAAGVGGDEYAFLRIRYKLPEEETSRLIETPITAADEIAPAGGGVQAREARFAASVAGFGQLLRGGRYTGDFDYDDVIALAQANKGDDEFGYRGEFVNLVRLAKSAASMERQQP